MTEHKFVLERGKTCSKEHISLEEYKDITNYKKTKEVIQHIDLELPQTPELKDIKKLMINRDEKIVNEIIKPKDDLIQKLYQDNLSLHKESTKQAKLVGRAENFEKNRVNLVTENINLKAKCENLKHSLVIKEKGLKYTHEDEIIHEFEKETYIDFDLEKQFKIKKIKEKEFEIEL